MILLVGVLVVLALIFAPSLWVKFVMNRYSSQLPEISGTGGELAKHLIERFSLKGVEVEITELGDHYDPIEKKVRLVREHYESKSLTAIAIAAHEVGHAIQDQQGDNNCADHGDGIALPQSIAVLKIALAGFAAHLAHDLGLQGIFACGIRHIGYSSPSYSSPWARVILGLR